MRSHLLVISLFLFLSFTFASDIISEVNRLNAGWTAGHNEFFAGRSLDDIKRLMGTKLNNPNPLPVYETESVGTPPDSFDSRQQWPGCIGQIRNQGNCGSCWAFGCVEAISDRFCIHSNGTMNLTLAPLDVVTCDKDDSGCEGGYPENCWSYAVHTGIVEEDCAPYNDSISTCAPDQQPCLNFVPTPKCPMKCVQSSVSWTGDKHFGKTAYAVSSKVLAIQTEIMTNGPVEAAFSVYEDFVTYKTGVYKHTTGKYLGGHAVKVIGWGVLNGAAYWTVANSWTTTWGDDGYFLILRGVDECGIESGIVAGLPNVSQ